MQTTNIHRPEREDSTVSKSKQTGKTSKRIHRNLIHRQTSTINFSHH